ncbi:hydrogenase formation protein HypD [Halanaerobacter jeridensis]|uniref:Hydrogenase expression/formation protein HypD n=1 Tax=Halanaerobacter jeridensis TaxID=706427 RepID=A0A938XRD5_9FIRM|nr:hydrogenase formation protein HypD [Halanaerobacter jeridensis]MBM7556334.1 hydrogenase expression/formation protein HypD [Halanaerobacter jeridensis]
MNYLEQFRAAKINSKLLEKLQQEFTVVKGKIKIMEVCGTHTQAISKIGLRELLPSNVELLTGPGCPICVTPFSYIDTAISLAQQEGVMVATFADFLKVPGSNSTLELEQAQGPNVKTVYSPLDAVKIAENNPEQEVVFLAVGFETTAPVIALSILDAQKKNLTNYSLLQALKTMPPVMEELVLNQYLDIDGFLCPGHVASIIGVEPFQFLAKEYDLPAVVAGFEVGDILFALEQIMEMIVRQEAKVVNAYPRVVEQKGNPKALKIMEQVFTSTVSRWRGLGKITNSGLELRPEYQEFAAENKFDFASATGKVAKQSGCSCGEVLMGIKKPTDCELFGTKCTPSHPLGPCMVSQEGSCAAYLYKVSVKMKLYSKE